MELYTEEELRDLLDEAYAMGQQDLVDYIDEASEEEDYDNAFDEDYEDDSLFNRVMQETSRANKEKHSDIIKKVLGNKQKFQYHFGGVKQGDTFDADKDGKRNASTYTDFDRLPGVNGFYKTLVTSKSSKGDRLRLSDIGDNYNYTHKFNLDPIRYTAVRLKEYRRRHGIPTAGSDEMRTQRLVDQYNRHRSRGFNLLGK